MSNYFSQIFADKSEPDILSRKYPYSIKNLQRKIDQNKDRFATLRESIEDVSIKDACSMKIESLGDGQMGSSLLTGFIPDIFTDTIVQFGQRVGVARRDFPIVNQSSNSGFKHRYIFRHDSCGIYREGDAILHSVSKRLTDEMAFIKTADSMMYTRELLEDSPISQIGLDMALANNKMNMLLDRLMWHELTYLSDETKSEEFQAYNYVDITPNDSGSPNPPTATMLITAMETAFLNITTRLEDAVEPSSLRWYLSPTAYAILFKDEQFRRYDILGQSPNFLTGQLPSIFRIPYTIITPGFFDIESNWQYEEFDIYLVGTGTAAIRMRADTRMEALSLPNRQMEGWQMSSRLRPYVINPITFIRISYSPTFPINEMENILYKPRDLSKTEGTMEMISIN